MQASVLQIKLDARCGSRIIKQYNFLYFMVKPFSTNFNLISINKGHIFITKSKIGGYYIERYLYIS